MIHEQHKEIVADFIAEEPVKLAGLAGALGLEVFKSPLKPDVSGLIEPSDSAPSGFRIRINRHEMAERQRFTLAHEIAHYLLHRDKIGGGVVDNIMYRSNLSSTLEVEANNFAADLIMPRALINKRLAELHNLDTDDKITALAERFRVSQAAMRIRLGV